MNDDRQYLDEEFVLNEGHSAARYALEGVAVFAVCFLAVRFGGWHGHLNPQEDVHSVGTWTALIAAVAVTAVAMVMRMRRLKGN